MGVSEVLAIIGLLIAVVAFVSEKNRAYLFLRFSTLDIVIVGILFLFVHLQISFYWVVENWFPSLKFLEIDGTPNASTYAYLTTLILLGYFSWVIFFKFFPTSNRERVIKYYQSLILKEEFGFLINLIERFHKKDISEYLQKVQTIKYQDKLWFHAQKQYEDDYEKLINTNRLKYAAWVFGEIVTNEIMLDNVVNKQPYFYTEFIKKLNTDSRTYTSFVQKYLRVLSENKNYHFYRELKNNDNITANDTYVIPEEHEILHSLFGNIEVAKHNSVWQPIGETAIDELEGYSGDISGLMDEYVSEEKNKLWNYKILATMHFFDIMVRAAIEQKPESHMWLYYFRTFSRKILKNIDNASNYDGEEAIPSVNHWLLHEIVTKCCDWIRISHKNDNKTIAIDSTKCLGEILLQIANSENLSDNQKVYSFDSCLSMYFSMSMHYGGGAEFYTKAIEDMLSKPNLTFESDYGDYPEIKNDYVEIMNISWDKFDKVPYQHHVNADGLIPHFQNEVLQKLGIEF